MLDKPRRDKLIRLLRRLNDAEKAQLRESTGIVFDPWQIDEKSFSDFNRGLTEYRRVLSSSSASAPKKADVEDGPTRTCDSCGASKKDSLYHVRIPGCATFCDECTTLLIEEARNARK